VLLVVTQNKLGQVFGAQADFKLIPMFTASQSQLGQWALKHNYDIYVKLIEGLPPEDTAATEGGLSG